MGEENYHLVELRNYLAESWKYDDNNINKCKVEGILEKTIRALEAGATPAQIKTVFAKHISAWQPDRSYG